jgi:hypothetical protein
MERSGILGILKELSASPVGATHAFYCSGGAAGFIDKTGKFIIPPRFVHALSFTR